MKKFRFRLQKLLQIKTHKKMEKQKDLAKAERMRRMEEAHLQMLHDRMSQEIDDLKHRKAESIDCRVLTQSTFYQQRLVNNMTAQKQAISSARKHEDAKREVLIEAAREEKIYEKLEERQHERYLQEFEVLQQKETDEIGQNTFLQREQKGRNKSPR